MNIKKTLLLIICLSVSQSFAQPSKQRFKPFTKTTDYLNEESNPNFYARMITKLLTELEKATPPGHRFCQTSAAQYLLYDSEEPFYIKIKKKN